ncbi:MAG: outer membrane protein assembly factor BamE domain-containing protein [Gammaproteobacteria bacterium]
MIQRRFRLRSVTWVLALAVAPPMITPAHADAPGNTGIQNQVDQLERRVQELEQEVHTLKARKPAATAQPQSPPPGPTISRSATQAPTVPHHDAGRVLTPSAKESWSALKEGMNGDQVRALLGEPSRRFQLNGQPVWYYQYTGTGNGSVMFTGNGRVTGWQHPPFGWLW